MISAAGWYLARLIEFVPMAGRHLLIFTDIPEPKANLAEKTFIITGSNVGIGLECARKLSEMGATVVLACRNVDKGEAAKQSILALNATAKVEVQRLNLSNLADVRAFASEWGERRLDGLVNNAGMTPSTYFKTVDGFEESFQANHLAHFLLTTLLLPVIAPHGRIVHVSSDLHFFGSMDPEDIDRSNILERVDGVSIGDPLSSKARWACYMASKLSQVAYARELQQRLDASPKYASKKIIVSSCHPGLVKSTIWQRYETTAGRFSEWFVGCFGISTLQGACTQTWLACDPSIAASGGDYYFRCKPAATSALVEDAKLRADMWSAWSAACQLPRGI